MESKYSEIPASGIVEVRQFSTGNPAETIADTFMAAAKLTTEWRDIEFVSFQVDWWADRVARIRTKGEDPDGCQRLSFKALWENAKPFQGDMRPFIDTPIRINRDPGRQFPRQDMKDLIEAFTGYKFEGIVLGSPSKVDKELLDQLRIRFGNYFKEKSGTDPLGFLYTEYIIPTFLNGVNLHLIHSDRFTYPQYTTSYPGFQDLVLEFNEVSLNKVTRFSQEYMQKMAERFHWFHDESDQKTKSTKKAHDTEQKTTADNEEIKKTYNPLGDLPSNEKAEVSAALNVLGISDTYFINEEDFKDTIKKKYQKLALQYHPDINKTANTENMVNLNLAYEYLYNKYGNSKTKDQNTEN